MKWIPVATGDEVRGGLEVLQLLGLPAQTYNDDTILLSSHDGLAVLNIVRMASTRGWVRRAPLQALGRAYKADREQFIAIVGSIHTAIALSSNDDGIVSEMVRDLLKLGEK